MNMFTRAAMAWGIVATLALEPAAAQTAAGSNLISEVRTAIANKDLGQAEQIVRRARSTGGDTPEVIAATSWLARGALAVQQLDKARDHAVDAYDLAVRALNGRTLDDPHLQTALGAAIEVQAQVRAGQGARSDAVYFLRRELEKYRDTPIHMRIQKNVNLLSLEGQRAPAFEVREYIGRPAPTLDTLKGKVVLLFFWAHWCPDCKAQGPIIDRLLQKYRAAGLTVVASTQRYGYIEAGRAAAPDEEWRHIVEVRDAYYGFLRNEPVPVSAANHQAYGVSSTPTLVLVDRQGIVRLYHPGRMTEEELEAAIRPLL